MVVGDKTVKVEGMLHEVDWKIVEVRLDWLAEEIGKEELAEEIWLMLRVEDGGVVDISKESRDGYAEIMGFLLLLLEMFCFCT